MQSAGRRTRSTAARRSWDVSACTCSRKGRECATCSGRSSAQLRHQHSPFGDIAVADSRTSIENYNRVKVTATDLDITTRRFEIEKQVFPHCMQVRNTYHNKRKTSGSPKQLQESPMKLPGETINSLLTDNYSEKKEFVEEWFQKNAKEVSQLENTRTPFADINLNIQTNVHSKADIHISTTQRSLGMKQNKRNNSIMMSTNSQVKLNSCVPYKKQKILRTVHNVHTNLINNKNTTVAQPDTIKNNEDFRSQVLDEPIVTKVGEEILVDKDHSAWLDILKSEEAQININYAPNVNDDSETEVMEKLGHALKGLKNEISHMKESNPQYILHKDARLFLSPQGLLKTLTAEHNSRSVPMWNRRNRVLNRTHGKICLKFQIPKKEKNCEPSPENLVQPRSLSLSFEEIFHLKNPNVDKTTQIGTGVANEVKSSENSNACENLQPQTLFDSRLQEKIISSEELIREDYLKLNDNSGNIVVVDASQQCDNIFPPVFNTDTNVPVDEEVTAHEANTYLVDVQVHASCDSPGRTSEDNVIEGSPQNERILLRLSNTLPLTRRRISFNHSSQRQPLSCYQHEFDNIEVASHHSSGNISNNSSDKENYDLNATGTVLDDCEKDKKHKENIAATRRPFTVLAETDVYERVCVACSFLDARDVHLVELLCKQQGWSFTLKYETNVTHLVVPLDEENKAPRSIGYVCALAAGKWIVSVQWAMQCLIEACHLEEEPFEVLDACGEPGPLRARAAAGSLFKGITFCLLPPYDSLEHHLLAAVVVHAGGRVVRPGRSSLPAAPHIALCQPVGGTYTDGVAAWRAGWLLLDYRWVVECLARYDIISPELFLINLKGVDQMSRVLDLFSTQETSLEDSFERSS